MLKRGGCMGGRKSVGVVLTWEPEVLAILKGDTNVSTCSERGR